MGGGRGSMRRQITGFMAEKTKEEWARVAIDQRERIGVLESKCRKLEIALMNARADLARILDDLQKLNTST